MARRVQQLRVELLRAISVEDLREVVRALIAQAKTGDVAAARELFSRALGPPVEVDVLARLENLEQVLSLGELGARR